MVIYIIKIFFRIIFLPMCLLLIGITALLEWIADSDFDYWRRFNEPLIKSIPFELGKYLMKDE